MDKLTKKQAIIITGYTGILTCEKFRDFHADAEKRLGTPIFTHEFATDAMRKKLHDAYKDDYHKLIYKED